MFDNELVSAFGKIFYIPTHESIPPLPEMSLLILKRREQNDSFQWRAICIDLEIDACGNTKDESWENLKKSLTMYINMEVQAAEGVVIEAAKMITKSAFGKSEQKESYIGVYRQAKMFFIMQAIEKGILDPVEREKQRLEKLKVNNESILSLVDDIPEEQLLAA